MTELGPQDFKSFNKADIGGEMYVRLQDVVVYFLDGADVVDPQARGFLKPLFELIAEQFASLLDDEGDE